MTKRCHRRQGKALSTSTHPRGLWVAAILLLAVAVGSPLPLAAAEPAGFAVRAARLGQRVVAPDLQSEAELVTLEPALVPRLLALAPEESLEVTDWPVAPLQRHDVVLTRYEVYDPAARIYKVEGEKLSEVPRSRFAFYSGVAADDGEVRVFVSVDPATGALEGFAQTAQGLHDLKPAPGAAAQAAGKHLVAAAGAFQLNGKSAARGWSCGEEEMIHNPGGASTKALQSIFGKVAAPFTSLHKATLAVDTDNELFAVARFNNDTTAATNYIASVIAGVNVMYERDMHVRLVQGTTFLRVTTTADPYVQAAAGNADGNKLNEFSSYWNVNMGSVNRALAAMFSGKQAIGSGGSGIAWISGLCSTSIGYSFTQIVGGGFTSLDAQLIGHEVGHNFGSPHTHCYSPAADNCFNQESGCYSGATSCPAATTINGVTGVTGTIMSYCHLLGGCGISMVFHPRSLTEYINQALTNANNVCVLPLTTAPTVASISPPAGTTAGGTAVTITGSNFVAGATVSLGGTAATAVNVANANTITATTAARSTGLVSVTVTNLDTGNGALSNAYFYDPPSGPLAFYTVSPCRLVDTRNPNGPLGGPALGSGTSRTFAAINHCGIPAGAKSVSANITVTGPGAGGFLSLFPGNSTFLGTSNLNFQPNQTRTNNVTLELATDGTGTLGVKNGAAGTVQVIIDVNGYFL